MFHRCQCVFKEGTSIACSEDHIFCKKCLQRYYRNGANSQCPSCGEDGLNESKMRPSKFADRIVGNLRVKCKLNYEQKKISTDNDDVRECEWKGELGKLLNHINEDCPLFVMICPHCNGEKKRFEMKEHDDVCPEKLLRCELKCS